MKRNTQLRRTSLALGGAAALAASLWTEDAHADLRGFTWERATINGGPRFATDDLNFGLGLNGGYTLDMGVYLGGMFNFFFGEDYRRDFGPNRIEFGFNAWMLMFEGGYDFGLTRSRKFVLRPTFGLGVVTAHFDCDVEGPNVPAGFDECDFYDDTDSEFEGTLSGQALYSIDPLTIGGELRFIFGDFDGVMFGFNFGGAF